MNILLINKAAGPTKNCFKIVFGVRFWFTLCVLFTCNKCT